ncbi:hypothetical protein [Nocardia sp. Marseille-Q1738]
MDGGIDIDVQRQVTAPVTGVMTRTPIAVGLIPPEPGLGFQPTAGFGAEVVDDLDPGLGEAQRNAAPCDVLLADGELLDQRDAPEICTDYGYSHEYDYGW